MSLFPLRRRGPAPDHRLPAGLRVYAIGDVHGRDDCLSQVERQIGDDLARRPVAGEALVIFLGDYVDRGPGTPRVIEQLATHRFAGLPARCLLGNHEDALLRFLADPVAGAAWLHWGGRATVASYGVDAGDDATVADPRRLAIALAEAMPAAHLAFLRDLKVTIELGGFLFVHAGIRPGVALDRQRREDLLWIREPFLASTRPGPHRVVHGHTIAEAVELLPQRIGVDTGAYATGRLSCVVIEGTTAEVLA
ncbi:metallophosphoesterase family protein [Sphingomonas bacterium]|uniref:metallophosphoesterase family protein n=1 Tax=Sphingomonas bacterium TaxID=1895847 RepID=UPI0015752E95|nr:metallophosphoesterase family protein [Sphingomonas bacterium]